jgi:hypothetical protein
MEDKAHLKACPVLATQRRTLAVKLAGIKWLERPFMRDPQALPEDQLDTPRDRTSFRMSSFCRDPKASTIFAAFVHSIPPHFPPVFPLPTFDAVDHMYPLPEPALS